MDRIWELAVILGLFVGTPSVFCWLTRGLDKAYKDEQSKPVIVVVVATPPGDG